MRFAPEQEPPLRELERIAIRDSKKHTVECSECGKQFVTTLTKHRFCSTKCSGRHSNRLREHKRNERIINNGEYDRTITLPKLYMRDGGVCHICGKQVNMNTNTNDDEYGSIDHLIPLSKGGTHTWGNVSLAHRRCNTIKSNRVMIQDDRGQMKIVI